MIKLSFQKLNQENIHHLELIKELSKDEEITRFLNIDLKNCFLVFEMENFIGLFNLCSGYFGSKENVAIKYAIQKDFRGKHYGSKLLNQIVKYAFNDPNIEYIYLDIDYQNISSIKCAENNGFSKSLIDKDIYDGEGYGNHIPYKKER